MSTTFGYTSRVGNDLPRKRHRHYKKLARRLKARPLHNVLEDTYSFKITSPINFQTPHYDVHMDVLDVDKIRTTIQEYQHIPTGQLGADRTRTFVTSGMRVVYDLHNLSSSPAYVDMYVVKAKDVIWDHRLNGGNQPDTSVPPFDWDSKNIEGTPATLIDTESVNLQCISNITTPDAVNKKQINRIGTSLYQISGFRDDFTILSRKTFKLGPGGDVKIPLSTPGVLWDIPGRHRLWNGTLYKLAPEVDKEIMGQVDTAQSYKFGHLAWPSSRFVIFIARGSVGMGKDITGTQTEAGYTECEIAVVARREVNWSFTADAYMCRRRVDLQDNEETAVVSRVRDINVKDPITS